MILWNLFQAWNVLHGATLIKVDAHRLSKYACIVAEKDATGIDSPNTHSGHTAQCGFFTSVDSWRPFNGGLGGEAARLAGGCVCRSVNPIQFRHPHLTVRGGLNATHGVRHEQ